MKRIKQYAILLLDKDHKGFLCFDSLQAKTNSLMLADKYFTENGISNRLLSYRKSFNLKTIDYELIDVSKLKYKKNKIRDKYLSLTKSGDWFLKDQYYK